ncbi:uncharacterized protein LOC142527679 isoform X2 [Primulina tabacum]|uniref:uncharacterized protein LOC142527679 isoform X2 n=1 Tax=Primulina tabacum TaxID=48773 RepID=UPI003F5912CB
MDVGPLVNSNARFQNSQFLNRFSDHSQTLLWFFPILLNAAPFFNLWYIAKQLATRQNPSTIDFTRTSLPLRNLSNDLFLSVVKTMPRKPLRCHKSLRHRQLSFSPFARSMAMIACAKKAKNKSQQIKLRNKDVQSASGNGKVEMSDSSVDEEFQNNKCLTELKDYLLEVCQGKDVVASLKSLFGEHALGVGIIVSQRVVNLPSQLLPPLYDALFDEIAWATEDEPTEELRNSFRFKTYIVISKIYKHKNEDQNAGKARNGDEVVIHIKPEDEIFLELSSWSFCFPLHAQQVTTMQLKNYRLMGLAMVVDANKVSMFRKQLHSLIDESQYHESFQQSCQIQDSVVSRHCL